MGAFVEIDHTALDELLRGRSGPVVADLARRTRNVEGEAKRLAPVDTGRLRSDIWSEVGVVDGAPTGRVGSSVNYALHVHEGTGLWGPTGQRITPRSAKVLRWTRGRGAGQAVHFARSVAGSPPKRYLRNALAAASR